MRSINQNIPEYLTKYGVKRLVEGDPHPEEYILQIIKILDFDNRQFLMSDGYAFLTGELSQPSIAKNSVQLKIFDIVRFTNQDIRISRKESSYYFLLHKFEVIAHMFEGIGTPIPYHQYYQNNFINQYGNSFLKQSKGKITDIESLLKNFPNLPKNWVLYARVTKKPKKMSEHKKFMIIELADEKNEIIEAVFFGLTAQKYYKELFCNEWYYFMNGIVKRKKSNQYVFQLKFHEESYISPVNLNKPACHYNTHSKNQTNDMGIKQIKAQSTGIIVNVNARVLKIQQKKIGRILNVMDQFDFIEILLWEDICDEVKKDQIYIFQKLRVKHYKGIISLQSVRNQTKIYHSIKRINYPDPPLCQLIESHGKKKQVPDIEAIKSLKQITLMIIEHKIQVDVHGYLIVNKSLEEQKFFKISCSDCSGSEVRIDPIKCKKCFSTNLIVKWNVRGKLIDEKEEVKCTINEQLCRKLFGWEAMEGLEKFVSEPEIFKAQLEKIFFREGIFKIKINPYKKTLFYNILEIYDEDSKVLLQRACNNLKKAMKEYEKLKRK